MKSCKQAGNPHTKRNHNPLTPEEAALLASARADGLVPFPEGSAEAVDRRMKTLESLESKGYLRRKRNAHVRGFYLALQARQTAAA